MYCQKCGNYNSEDKFVCTYCGYHINTVSIEKNSCCDGDISKQQNQKKSYCKNKYGKGIALSIVLGLFGFIIGLFIYPFRSYERKTFIKGWLKGLEIVIVISIVISIVVFYTELSILDKYYV